MLKKILVGLALLTVVQSLYAEPREYFVGTLNLAGLVPIELPEPGTLLRYQNLEQALTTWNQQTIGYIPRKFRDPLNTMLQVGLELRFEVGHVFADPLPGKFISIEVWVRTEHPEKIQPLIYSIPALERPPLTAIND